MKKIAAINIGDAFKLGGQPISTKPGYHTVSGILNPVIKTVYVVSGVIILFGLIAGGLTMIANAGNPEKQQQGSKTLTASVIGFLIVFSSYWIIQVIEVITSVSILSPGI